MKNQPYIKQLDEKGNILNPIVRRYESKTFLGTQKITDEVNQTKYVPVYLPNRSERRNKGFIKNETVLKLRESYLKQVKNAFANGFENLERTINNIKSACENYKKAFFNSALYLRTNG